LFSCGFVRRFEPDQVHLKTRRRQKRLRRCRFGGRWCPTASGTSRQRGRRDPPNH
jgi:hypothetical protein